ELRMLRRGEDAQSRLEVARAEQRLAELDTFYQAGLWQVRVLAGAASPEELSRIAPVLVGSMELNHHPYRLRAGYGAESLAEALHPIAPPARLRQSGGNDSSFPFPATAGALAALAGLPRREVPGLRVLEAGYFDVTSETESETEGEGEEQIELGAILDGQDREGEIGRASCRKERVDSARRGEIDI